MNMESPIQDASPANVCGEIPGHLCEQLKALGHPVRIDIIRLLLERDGCCCGDFCASLPLAQSTVSQHLDQLRRSGLVDYSPDGTRSRYSLNRTAFKALAHAISTMADSPRTES